MGHEGLDLSLICYQRDASWLPPPQNVVQVNRSASEEFGEEDPEHDQFGTSLRSPVGEKQRGNLIL